MIVSAHLLHFIAWTVCVTGSLFAVEWTLASIDRRTELSFWVNVLVFRRHKLLFTVCETQAHRTRFYMNHVKSNKFFFVNSFISSINTAVFFLRSHKTNDVCVFFLLWVKSIFLLARKQNKPSESLSQQRYRKKNTYSKAFAQKKRGATSSDTPKITESNTFAMWKIR